MNASIDIGLFRSASVSSVGHHAVDHVVRHLFLEHEFTVDSGPEISGNNNYYIF